MDNSNIVNLLHLNNVFVGFLWKNTLFSFSVILLSLLMGWVLYGAFVTRKIQLRDALFEKDNLAAWIEFIGAFIFPVFYLAADAVSGSASENIFIDLGVCLVYVIAYVVLMTVLRLSSGLVVKLIGAEDEAGKVNLNNEIYNQKNVSAALFSVSLSIIFASIISQFEVIPAYIFPSVVKMLDVLIYSLLAIIFYLLFVRRTTTLFKEIFIDNNPAAGISLVGFVFAVEMLLINSVTYNPEYNYLDSAIVGGICLVIFGVINLIIKAIFSKILKMNMMQEIYEQNNIGAAIGQMAVYIGIANMLIHFIK